MWHQVLTGLGLEVKNRYGSVGHKTNNLSLCHAAIFYFFFHMELDLPAQNLEE